MAAHGHVAAYQPVGKHTTGDSMGSAKRKLENVTRRRILDETGDGTHAIRLERDHQFLNPIRSGDAIAVLKRDQRPLCGANAPVAAGVSADRAFVSQPHQTSFGKSPEILFEQGRCPIRRAIVDHDDFEIRIGLPEESIQTVDHLVAAVARGNDDRNERLGGTLLKGIMIHRRHHYRDRGSLCDRPVWSATRRWPYLLDRSMIIR